MRVFVFCILTLSIKSWATDLNAIGVQCIQDICGKDLGVLFETKRKIEQQKVKRNRFYEEQIVPVETKLAHAALAYDMRLSKNILAFTASNPTVTDPLAIRIFHFFRIANKLMEIKLQWSPTGLKVDRKKSPPLDLFDIQASETFANTYVRVARSIALGPQGDPKAMRVAYRGDALIRATQQSLQQIEQIRIDLRSTELSFLADSSELTDILEGLKEKIVAGNISDSVLKSLFRISVNAHLLKILAIDDQFKKSFTSAPLRLTNYPEYLKIIPELNRISNGEPRFSQESGVSRCRTALEEGQAILASDQQLDNFKKREPELRAMFKSKVRKILPPSLYRALLPEINKFEFVYAPTKETHPTELVNQINDQVKKYATLEKKTDAFLLNNKVPLLMASLWSFEPPKSKDEGLNDDDPMELACPSVWQIYTGDQTMGGSSALYVGPLPVKLSPWSDFIEVAPSAVRL